MYQLQEVNFEELAQVIVMWAQRWNVSIHGLAPVRDLATLRLVWVATGGRLGRG